MNLSTLLRALPAHQIKNRLDVEITSITSDSRQVIPGALFVAYPGVNVDGTAFIPQALERGAAAIVAEQLPGFSVSCPLVLVPNARSALAYLVAAWHDFPSRKLKVIGITGTDGKTTTCKLTAAILAAAGRPVGSITTVSATIGNQEIDTGFHTTTPGAPDIQRYLAQMTDAGMEYAVVEATSHGLAQRRLDAVDFDVAAVTNITHEHLDIHGTWENYRDAKAMLFRSLAAGYRKPATPKVAVLNADDNSRGVFDYLREIPVDVQVVYSANPRFESLGPNYIFARDVHHARNGLRLRAITPRGELEIESPLIGRYNVSNILAAIGIGLSLQLPFEAMQAGIARVRVTGRMQIVDRGQPFIAIVDFAHTPYALQVALETAQEIAQGRVIIVFGCAGLRDVQKRPWMGQIAGKLADYAIVTAEDPRTENLDAINAQVAEGLKQAGKQEGAGYQIIRDRGQAIAAAVKMARPGDLVIVTGKGHERSMCFGTTEFPWSDQEALTSALDQLEK
ncbi:MAG: UDP-N-acetylmuramoyl-L-alanyl-D-glutamate--2,6-diaminopimelate ligase [Chloroflexi bacterium]|nr:UDP-N-acetylmuramoyl-L-alanyl-D-glutamate--2,6-diaminopimelate ligase [Chloroflexota bacterium]